MEVLILLLFISMVLVAGAVVFFVKVIEQGDLEHGDRLALLPLDPEGEEEVESDQEKPAAGPTAPESPETAS